SQWPAAATGRVGMLPFVWLSSHRLAPAETTDIRATTPTAAAAVTKTASLDVCACSRDRTIRPAPNAAGIDSGAPTARSNRGGKPCGEVGLPAYIRRHHPTIVQAASTGGGARKFLAVTASAARPKSPSHTSAGPSSTSRWLAAGTGWLPRSLATAVEVCDEPEMIPPRS